MIINRIKQHLARGPSREPPVSYYYVETRAESIPVSPWTARVLIARLAPFWRPRWVTFRDLANAQHTLRSAEVYLIRESTPTTRAQVRAFRREREREQEEESPPWLDG